MPINKNLQSQATTSYPLASLWRSFFARLFDWMIVSILPFVLEITSNLWSANHVWPPLMITAISVFLMLGGFIFIPYFSQGRSLGKYLLRIKLVTKKTKISFWAIFSREFILVFVPWLIAITINLIIAFAYHINLGQAIGNEKKHFIPLLLFRVSVLFYFLWYLGLGAAIKFDKYHQFFVDHYFELFVVNPHNLKKSQIKKKPYVTIDQSYEHSHLGHNQPGNISEEILDEINEL